MSQQSERATGYIVRYMSKLSTNILKINFFSCEWKLNISCLLESSWKKSDVYARIQKLFIEPKNFSKIFISPRNILVFTTTVVSTTLSKNSHPKSLNLPPKARKYQWESERHSKFWFFPKISPRKLLWALWMHFWQTW